MIPDSSRELKKFLLDSQISNICLSLKKNHECSTFCIFLDFRFDLSFILSHFVIVSDSILPPLKP